jgi:enoyl reductase-like protein
MKYIITEEQYDIVIGGDSLAWVKRRYNLVHEELKNTIEFTKDSICRYNTYEEFEQYFFSVLMDCLHPYFYDNEDFDYEGVFHSLVDLFYVECTEFYFDGRERCS